MSASLDIVNTMAALGLGTVGTDLFQDILPDAPDTATAALTFPGAKPDMAMGTIVRERVNLQIQCRSLTFSTAEANVEAAFKALAGKKKTAPSGNPLWFDPVASPAKLKEDEKNRLIMYCEFAVTY